MNKKDLFDFDLDITTVKSLWLTASSTSDAGSCIGDCTIICTRDCPYESIGVEPCYTDDTCGANRCRV